MLKTLSIIGYVFMAGGVIAQFATRNLFSSSPFVIVIQISSVLLLVWARVAFGRRSFHVAATPTRGGLVTGGPYRYIRHPIYTAMCVFSLAGALAHQSWEGAVLGGVVLGSGLVRIFCEEILVTARYPEYQLYAAKTWRMIPYVFCASGCCVVHFSSV